MKKLTNVKLNITYALKELPKWGEMRQIYNLLDKVEEYTDLDDKEIPFKSSEVFEILEGYRGQRFVALRRGGEYTFLRIERDDVGKYLTQYVPEHKVKYKCIMRFTRQITSIPKTPTVKEKEVPMQVHVKTESLRTIPKTGLIVSFIDKLNTQDGYTDRNNVQVKFPETAFFRIMVGFRNKKWIEFIPDEQNSKSIVFLALSYGDHLVELDDPRVNGTGQVLALITRSQKADTPIPQRGDLAKRLLDSDRIVGNAFSGNSIDDVPTSRSVKTVPLANGMQLDTLCDDAPVLEYLISFNHGQVWEALKKVFVTRGKGAMTSVTLGVDKQMDEMFLRLNDHSTTEYYVLNNDSFEQINKDGITDELIKLNIQMKPQTENDDNPTKDVFGKKAGIADIGARFRGGHNAHRPFGAGVRETQCISEEERKPEPTALNREWIPQMNQFVKVEGMGGTYVISDYDDYDDVFIVRLADSCRRERESRLTSTRYTVFDHRDDKIEELGDIRVPGDALRPIVLKY